ncbi:MAG: hypothetical protein CMJ70_04605 [Planctomycetaceae bacterium]|nr:hypothetical protein [Planctomycetaceae bacterium]
MSFRRRIAHTHSTGLTRREILQVGYSGAMGLALPALFANRAQAAAAASAAAPPRDGKKMLLVWTTGAMSHHDTVDMKPDAPAEVRGEFKPAATSIPGFQMCEHMPELIKHADKFAVVRSFAHKDNNHLMSTHHVLTGQFQPGAFFDKIASRTDWPNYAGAYDYFRPRHDGIPNGVNLPTFMQQPPLIWPGQHAGLLGATHDPWQITSDPNSSDFKVDSLTLSPGLDVDRVSGRHGLLGDLNRQRERLSRSSAGIRMTSEQELAYNILTSRKLADAFKVDQETDAMRDNYGRHTTGQSLLLARRLLEVGVPVVQVNVGNAQNWDNHSKIFPTLKDRLLPPLDKGMGALLSDLSDRGMLDDTFVVLIGEFGRTPKINKDAGRDHWGPCFSGLFAGGGVKGGQVIGKTDPHGSYPISHPYSPEDIGATVYTVLGIDPASEMYDRFNRPIRLNSGTPIAPLFG